MVVKKADEQNLKSWKLMWSSRLASSLFLCSFNHTFGVFGVFPLILPRLLHKVFFFQILWLLNLILARPHPVLSNKPPLFPLSFSLSDSNFRVLICRSSDFLFTPSLFPFITSVTVCSPRPLHLAPCFIYRILMMQKINENLIASRSGALPPVGGFIHDAATVSHTVPPSTHLRPSVAPNKCVAP